jgi:hypothetical protein
MKNTLITLTVLASLTPAASANPSAESGPPGPPKEVAVLSALVGTWTSKNLQMTMDGKKFKGELTITCVASSGGFGVSCNDKFNIQGLGILEESDLFGYDPQAKLYHWFGVTSRGDTHDHVAMPPTGSDPTMTFAYSGFLGGKPMQEVLVMGFNKEMNKMEFKNTGLVGGQVAWGMVATITKK